MGQLIGRSPQMEKLYRILSKVAHSNHPVLILGESGTGKEMVARTIHSFGPNPERPFLPVDCGSLVPTLIESELFGYVKGAFTVAQIIPRMDCWLLLEGEQFSSTRSGNSPSNCRPSCCARSRRRKCGPSALRCVHPSKPAF